MKPLSLVTLLFVVASSCLHSTPCTAAQLAAKGRHPAPVNAAAISLPTLGYRVTARGLERGIVKTSATTTASIGAYSATASPERKASAWPR